MIICVVLMHKPGYLLKRKANISLIHPQRNKPGKGNTFTSVHLKGGGGAAFQINFSQSNNLTSSSVYVPFWTSWNISKWTDQCCIYCSRLNLYTRRQSVSPTLFHLSSCFSAMAHGPAGRKQQRWDRHLLCCAEMNG